MSERAGTNRRAFFGRAWRDALAAAPKPFAVAAGMGDPPQAEPVPAPEPPRFSPALAAPPQPATGGMTLDDLLAQTVTVGLDGRAEAIRSLARWSVRLTPAPGGRSQLGGFPGLARDVEWPAVEGRPLAFLAQIDLTHGAAAPPLPPAAGCLLFFADVDGTASGTAVDGRVLLTSTLAADPRDRPPLPGPVESPQSLEHSLELSLPRVWSAPVEALDLRDVERDGWQELRAWLAERQRVELHDRTAGFLALHRLLGYPDETGGDMPLSCELLAAGAVLDEPYPRMHPLARALEPRAERWRLLLQLSVGGVERVYFWIASEDLDAAEFSRVRVIRR